MATHIAQAFILHEGKHFVCYPDGKHSRVMPKHNAEDYAEIFGGTVQRHPAFPTLWQKLLAKFKGKFLCR